MSVDYSDQVSKVIELLGRERLNRDHPAYEQSIKWIANFPHTVEETKRKELIAAITSCFDITELDIYAAAFGGPQHHEPIIPDHERELESKLPKTGWLRWYVDHTRFTESPLSYHIFSSLTALGAALGRRVYKEKGFFRIYPNFCTILIGPTGRVMKTSAVDVAKNLVKKAVLCPIMADAITPESLVDTLSKNGGHQFIYAPEASVFLGKQRYNEGLTTLMLRLLDCPDEFTRRTLGAGETTITNVALSILAGSTLSLLSGASPETVTSGGFLNRFVLVVENDSPRIYPEPQKGKWEDKLVEVLERLKAFSGPIKFGKAADQWFDNWYRQRKNFIKQVDSETAAEVIQRGPMHLERMSILIHLAHCDTFEICPECCTVAQHLLEYYESKLPQMVSALSGTVSSRGIEFITTALRKHNGVLDRTTLMHKTSHRMDRTELDRHLGTLKEMKTVREEKRGLATVYILEEKI